MQNVLCSPDLNYEKSNLASQPTQPHSLILHPQTLEYFFNQLSR
jgi:hypothetical protein